MGGGMGTHFLLLVLATIICTADVGAQFCNQTAQSSGGVEQVEVSPISALDLTRFDCEEGDFNVLWSGNVDVSGTIVIGSGTTVRIVGSDTLTASSSGNFTESSSLSGLTSAAVNMVSPLPGPVFVVQGGQLFLESIAVRGGNASTAAVVSGGGVHAVDANVTVTGCEFEDNFASLWGGGIFANRSTLVVEGSVFRRCSADVEPSPGDDGVEGAGGGIGVEQTNVMINSSLFDSCYASIRGGGFHQYDGYASVSHSSFFNNSAGSDNVDSEEPIGEGGAVSFFDCHGSFDGLSECGANDTTFMWSHVAKKGAAIIQASMNGPTTVEFHRCKVENSFAGAYHEDDAQGEGGAIVVGGGSTVVLDECVFWNNTAGKKGGVMMMSSDKDEWLDGTPVDPVEEGYGVALLRNSTFRNNTALSDNGGVVNLETLASLFVQGTGNLFEGNSAVSDGAVFSSTTDTTIEVDGGDFVENESELGGVLWTKGNITVRGGTFVRNIADDAGGVMLLSGEAIATITDGRFAQNEAGTDGGVVSVASGAKLLVEGGEYFENDAGDNGGVFSVGEDGDIEITGGTFSGNEADYGGFLYTDGEGITSCKGASVEDNQAVDGGGMYAVDGAIVEWECNIFRNSALSGPAIYARDKSDVTIQGATLSNNVAATGSVIFVVDQSNIKSFQVVFNDTSGAEDLSAVQVGEKSSFKGEDTSFVGFGGEAIVDNEGELYLDHCDFSGSNASVLVHSDGEDAVVVIRNTVLGNDNYFDAERQPKGDSLINVVVSCEGSSSPPCSDGSSCLDGDLGVYCLCYKRALNESQEICLDGDVRFLSLAEETGPGQNTSAESLETFILPDTPEKYLHLSLGSDTTSSTTSSRASEEGGAGGVMWTASTSSVSLSEEFDEEDMDWKVFPSTGMLLPGQSVDLRVASSPSDDFDGIATTTVVVNGEALNATAEVDVSFDVAFYHCDVGEVWKMAETNTSSSSCEICADVVEDRAEGIDCEKPGSTTRALPVKSGFWRTTLDSFVIHECLNPDACRGGASVTSVTQYCNEGYEGPLCAVCSSGYGGGVANACHECSSDFKAGMYFVIATVSLLVLALAALLAVYLVGGTDAVSTTLSKTKQSVASGLKRSEHGGSSGKGDTHGVSEGSIYAGTNPVFTPALASTSEVADVGSARVPAEAPSSQRVGGSEKEKTTVAYKVQKFLGGLPLSKLKIVIVVWQISSSFSGITQVPFPSAYEKFLGIIGIFSFDLGWMLSAACLATGISFFDKLLMVTIGPLFLFFLLGATYFLGRKNIRNVESELAADDFSFWGQRNISTPGKRALSIHPRGSHDSTNLEADIPKKVSKRKLRNEADAKESRLWDLFARHTTVTLIILYLVYSQVSTVVFQTFACENFSEEGKSYLRADFRVECNTAKHEAFKIYAAIMICIYPLGIPAAFCFLLLRQGSRINPPMDPNGDQQAVMERRAADRAIAPTYFLWNAFVPNRYYYEVLECGRRLLLTGLLVFLQPDSPGQVAFGCIFAFLSLMVFELLRPHADKVERQLYRTGCLLIFFTNFLALTIKAEVASPESSGSTAYSVVLVIANVCFFLAAFSNTWFVAKDAMAKRAVTDMVFGVTVSEDPLPRSANHSQKEQKYNSDGEMVPEWDT
eukprot:g9725.t1